MATTGALQFAARDLALDQLAVVTLAVLRDAGIDALLVKGPVTTLRLYAGEPYRRHYTDVDLLVGPAEFDRAEVALADNGYRRADDGVRSSERSWRERTWLPPGGHPLHIDLHRSLAYVEDPGALWTELWRARTELLLQAGPVPVPDVAGTALVLALHASLPGRSSQPARDLDRAVAVLDEEHWAAAVGMATRAGALTGMRSGLASVPAARPLLERFGLSSDVPTAMRLVFPGTSPAGQAVGRLLAFTTRREQVIHVVGRVFPSHTYMRKHWPGSHSRWGLTEGYLRRWAWLLGSLPDAVSELRRLHGAPTSPSETWTVEALETLRGQLADGGLEDADPPGPPVAATDAGVRAGLDRHDASCLERSLVLQRFGAARGRRRDLVIGVSAPSEGFHAHAWLAGDDRADESLTEILRRPTPEHWVGIPHQAQPHLPFRPDAVARPLLSTVSTDAPSHRKSGDGRALRTSDSSRQLPPADTHPPRHPG